MIEKYGILPTSEEYAEAFRTLEANISPIYRRMLHENYYAPHKTLTAREMAQRVGYSRYSSANLHYGKFAGLICKYFGREYDFNLRILVRFSRLSSESELDWVMHPQVAEALEVIGWVEKIPLEEERFHREFHHKTECSLKEKSESRRQRLKQTSKFPSSVRVIRTEFKRNPDVVAEVLAHANGYCEECGNPAPFIRASDGTPYLEIHHKTFLSDGGEDTVENTMALCPNCHREKHFGM